MRPEKIRKLRERFDWSQLQLATYLGMSLRMIQYYESGRPLPLLVKRALGRLQKRKAPPALPQPKRTHKS